MSCKYAATGDYSCAPVKRAESFSNTHVENFTNAGDNVSWTMPGSAYNNHSALCLDDTNSNVTLNGTVCSVDNNNSSARVQWKKITVDNPSQRCVNAGYVKPNQPNTWDWSSQAEPPAEWVGSCNAPPNNITDANYKLVDIPLNNLKRESFRNVENFASTLQSPGSLQNGERIVSDNGQYELVNQTDGHLCLNQVNGPAMACWGPYNGDGSGFTLPNHVDVQTDGNLCNYGSSGQGNWCTMTHGRGSGAPYTLKVTDNGQAQVLDSAGNNTWN